MAVPGVMTFMVNQDGVLYEKNLGKGYRPPGAGIDSFDPDDTWRKVDEP